MRRWTRRWKKRLVAGTRRLRTFCAVVLFADRPLSEAQRRWLLHIGKQLGYKQAMRDTTWHTSETATAWIDPAASLKNALRETRGRYFQQNRPKVPHIATVPVLPRIPSQKLAQLINEPCSETPAGKQPVIVEPLPDGDDDATEKTGTLERLARNQA